MSPRTEVSTREVCGAGQLSSPAPTGRRELEMTRCSHPSGARLPVWVNRVVLPLCSHFRSPPINGHRQSSPVGPFRADIVAKVENRTTLKISRKSIFGLLCCCVALQRHYGGRLSILNETIWSLTSPRVKRISGSKNFRPPPQKDFCNNICQQRKSASHSITSAANARRDPGTSKPCVAVLRLIAKCVALSCCKHRGVR